MYTAVPRIVVDCSSQPQVVIVVILLFAFGCKGSSRKFGKNI